MEYKWVVLTNTTMGGLMASINSTIVIISLPAIFRGLNINPVAPGNFDILLWILMGYMLVMAAFLVTFGRLSDNYGRKRFYTIGFVIFLVASVALSLVPYNSGINGALFIIIFRFVQAIGGGFIMVNSTALLTDVFPDNERGKALGLNQVAFMSGSLIGILLGGILTPFDFHYIFLVNVPFALLGVFWSYRYIKEKRFSKKKTNIDIIGNLLVSIGLVLISLGFTYALVPYDNNQLGWMNPWVILSFVFGIISIIGFIFIESKVKNPLLDIHLFSKKAFSFGSLALLFNTLARGSVMFLIIIWLQGIYLPANGFPISKTPFWAGIYMIPFMLGFVVFGPISGYLTDKFGARIFSTTGLIINGIGIFLLTTLPANFNLTDFLIILFIIGAGGGLFSAPNTKRIMDALPISDRGAGNGIRITFANIGQLISLGLFFTISISVFSNLLPSSASSILSSLNVPKQITDQLSGIPSSSILFSALLGINPIKSFITSLPSNVISSIPQSTLVEITSDKFIPILISEPFIQGLRISMYLSLVFIIIAIFLSAAIKRRNEIVEDVHKNT